MLVALAITSLCPDAVQRFLPVVFPMGIGAMVSYSRSWAFRFRLRQLAIKLFPEPVPNIHFQACRRAVVQADRGRYSVWNIHSAVAIKAKDGGGVTGRIRKKGSIEEERTR